MHISKCPKCGKSGFAYTKFLRCGRPNCRCMLGLLHGPYHIVEHYKGYDAGRSRKRITKICYIRSGKRRADQRRLVFKLLNKYVD